MSSYLSLEGKCNYNKRNPMGGKILLSDRPSWTGMKYVKQIDIIVLLSITSLAVVAEYSVSDRYAGEV